MVVFNLVQDITLFQENIIECTASETTARIDAIYKFNGERCHIAIDKKDDNSSNFRLLNDEEMNSIDVYSDRKHSNCIYRMGTDLGLGHEN